MSLGGNVLLSQNKRLSGLWTFVIRIIKPFSLISSLSSLLFHALCFPMWPFLRENHQVFTSFSPFIPCKILFRVPQCLPGGEGARGEFEETLSCPSKNPSNGFLLVVGIPGDYSTIIWWQWFCLERQHFRFVREFWCLNKPMKSQHQSCWGVSSSTYQDQDVTWNKNSEKAQSWGSDGHCDHTKWLNTFLCLLDLMEGSQRTLFLTAFGTPSLNNK